MCNVVIGSSLNSSKVDLNCKYGEILILTLIQLTKKAVIKKAEISQSEYL